MLLLVCPVRSFAASTVQWRDWGGIEGYWEQTDAWWYPDWGDKDQHRPDLAYRTDNDIYFDNNAATSMTLNNNAWFYVHSLIFQSGASSARTINRSGTEGLDLWNYQAKIQNHSTATHTFNVPIAANNNNIQINALAGDLTFNSEIYNSGYTVEFFGSSNKLTTINGNLQDSGGIHVRPDAAGYHKVVLTTSCDYSGTTKITEGELWVAQNGAIYGSSTGVVDLGNATFQNVGG